MNSSASRRQRLTTHGTGALDRARAAAERRYGRDANVVAVSAGLKFVNGRATGDAGCIQFLIRRKRRKANLRGRALPAYVFGRDASGRVNRQMRFRTDVIEVGAIELAGGAGDRIEATGSQGAITLLFRNKRAPDRRNFYLVTCAHVVGNLDASPPPNPEIESETWPQVDPFARTIASATHRAGRIAYDVALARIAPGCRPLLDLRRAGDGGALDGFFPREQIVPGLGVDCHLPASLAANGLVSSYAMTVPVIFRGRPYTVDNVYLVNVRPCPGDSGGLLYRDRLAVGMLVARSDAGWGWFQPLAPAVEYLRTISSVEIQCFNQP